MNHGQPRSCEIGLRLETLGSLWVITVTTEEGKVTLAGNVRSWNERREVATAAWHAPGVTNVENLISVN